VIIQELQSNVRLKAVRGGKGPADALYVDEKPKPEPGNDEALVRIKAFGLNRMDLLEREGKYPLPPQAPGIMGVEFSGVIESFGPNTHSAFKIGDEVFGLTYGGWSEHYTQGLVDQIVNFIHRLLCRICCHIDENDNSKAI
jgi:NADPH:quinone reductase-like Zn-dependent oxidoreductase